MRHYRRSWMVLRHEVRICECRDGIEPARQEEQWRRGLADSQARVDRGIVKGPQRRHLGLARQAEHLKRALTHRASKIGDWCQDWKERTPDGYLEGHLARTTNFGMYLT